METTNILKLIQLGKELGYKTKINISNILGKSKCTIDYDNYKINNDKLFYNSRYSIYLKDIVSIEFSI